MVETKSTEPLPDGSTVPPEGSQEKGDKDLQGTIIGLKAQLKRAKDDNKELQGRVDASEQTRQDDDSLGWVDQQKKMQKELDSLTKLLKESAGAKQTLERKLKLVEFSSSSGIPIEVLEGATDELDLATKVATWKKDTEEPPTVPIEPGNLGVTTTPKSIWAQSSAEFAETEKDLQAKR